MMRRILVILLGVAAALYAALVFVNWSLVDIGDFEPNQRAGILILYLGFCWLAFFLSLAVWPGD